jgi:hypothetical protein
MQWRPSLADFTGPMVVAQPWSLSLAALRRGIDNAHIDCLLGERFREQATTTIHKLVREDATSLSRRLPEQLVGSDDLAALRDAYLCLFESALERHPGKDTRQTAVLLGFALLKYLLQLVAHETLALQEGLKTQIQSRFDWSSAARMDLHERLILVTRQAQAIQRRVTQILFRQVRKLETSQIRSLRASVLGQDWPIPEAVLFNPILFVPDPGKGAALAADYPLGWLADSGIADWPARTAGSLYTTFVDYLPAWLTGTEHLGAHGGDWPDAPADRRDRGELRGFLSTEILLGAFVPRLEYTQGLTSWLDEPANLRLFLDSGPASGEGTGAGTAHGSAARWQHPEWADFHRDRIEQLTAGLESAGLLGAIECAYALPALRNQLGCPLPFPLLLDYAEDRLSRRQLVQRLAGLRTGPEPPLAQQALERMPVGRRQRTLARTRLLLGRYLVDFLTLRRDLKLAYKTFEVLDEIRFIEDEHECRLSRTNGSLYELSCRGETDQAQAQRRIRGHAVLKADVRGSTLITEELRARGLNPASHFSLNFFNPVNALLPEFGAEKLFVEGDAVIIGLYEYLDEGSGLAVTLACRLARKILQVVTLQNVGNRQNDLPELELGLGIAFSQREPNFLYDEGRAIMISSAINQADRLSSCSGLLLRSGFAPPHPALHVAVVRDAVGGDRAGAGRDLLTYNVNGVKLDETAFLKLEEELAMTQLRLPADEAPEGLFFVGSHTDESGRAHWVVLRHAPVLDWYGDAVGPVEPDRRHYFELIVDEDLARRIRRLAAGG